MKTRRIITAIAALALSSASLYAAEAPSFPGGAKAMGEFIAKTLKYPQTAVDNMVEGKVVIKVEVLADGSLKNPKVVRKVDPDLEAEAIRIVMLMPKWTPADKEGAAVVSSTEIPVNFRLQ